MTMGFPSNGFWSDNGCGFQNKKMDELVTKRSLTVKFRPAYSPWSNRINEQNHGIADTIWKNAMMTDPELTQQKSVDLAEWCTT